MEDQNRLKELVDESVKEANGSLSKELAEIRSMLLEVIGNKATMGTHHRDTTMEVTRQVHPPAVPTLRHKPTSVEFGRFQGANPEGWIFQAERYFDFYGTEEDQKLTVAKLYLEGEALEWYKWLFRNNQLIDWPHFAAKVRIRFKQKGLESAGGRVTNLGQVTYVNEYQNRSEDMETSFHEADVLFPGHTYVHPQCSNITNSLLTQYYGEQSECQSHAHQVFDKLPEKCYPVDAWDFTNRGITGIAAPDDIVTPQNERSKSTEVAALVHESSAVTKDPMFAEISYTTANLDFHVPNASVHDEVHSALIVANISDTRICRNDGLHAEVTMPELNESSHYIKFTEIRSIAPPESLLFPFDSPEVVRPHEHLEQDMSMRYVDVNFLVSGSPKWKTDLETFEDWYLADFFMEPVGNEDLFLNILTSLMHSVKILLDTENGNSIRELNGQHILSQFRLVPAINFLIVTIPMIAMNLRVWDPGIRFNSMTLTGYTDTVNVDPLQLLGFTDKFCSIAYANSGNRVWDPGLQWYEMVAGHLCSW